MPNVTQLPIINTATSQTFFMVVDNRLTKRLNFQSLPSSFVGYVGSRGAVGPIGPLGNTGPSGPQGITGSVGPQGPRGEVGYSGSLGNLGYTGSIGIGYVGSRGLPGGSGDPGDLGYVGSIGYTGSIGPAGPAGGYTGSQGDPGPIGSRGDPGGYTGSQGDIGYSGSASRDGYAGSAGYAGSQGFIGYAGSRGGVGLPGYAGSAVSGPRGYTGSMVVGYAGSAASSGGIGLNSRTTASVTTALIANGVTTQITLFGYKTYMLSKVVTSDASWVRIYTDPSNRASDLVRLIGNDPVPGSGVIAEVVTTPALLTQMITPGVIGFNGETPANNSIFLNVTNNSGSTRAITVTLTLLQLEA